jgi:hypothetical protein
MTELEERIVNFIAESTGIKAKKVHLDSRLAQDIGMEGDDAGEFFEKFHEQFHFLPEGIGVPPLGCMVMIGVGVVAGGLLHDAFNWIPAWAAMGVLTTLFCGIYGWIYSRLLGEPQDDKIPITVQDLVEAANAGKWVKSYQEQENRQP